MNAVDYLFYSRLNTGSGQKKRKRRTCKKGKADRYKIRNDEEKNGMNPKEKTVKCATTNKNRNDEHPRQKD